MTLFERIIAKEVPAEILHEDRECVAIRDINPMAPVHILIIPRLVVSRLGEAGPEHAELLGHLLLVAAKLAKNAEVAESGFRVVINHGRDAGETVPHLHVHLLGGRSMGWPPG